MLGGLDKVRACVAYRVGGKSVKDFPASMKVLSRAEPVYRDLRGWPELPEDAWTAIAGKGKRALPEPVKRYLAFLETRLRVPVKLASVGRSRAATMPLAR